MFVSRMPRTGLWRHSGRLGYPRSKKQAVGALDALYKRRLDAEEGFGPKQFFCKKELVLVGDALGLKEIDGLVPGTDSDMDDDDGVRCHGRCSRGRENGGRRLDCACRLSLAPRPLPAQFDILAGSGLPARNAASTAAFQPMFGGEIPGLDSAEAVLKFEATFKVQVNRPKDDKNAVFNDDDLRRGTTQGDYRRRMCHYAVSPAARSHARS